MREPDVKLPFPIPPVGLLAVAGAAQFLARRRPPGPGRRAGAAGLTLASAGFLLGSLREFRRSHTTVNPVAPSQASALVVTGPHRLTRHPMYVGMAGLLSAHAIARGHWAAALPVAGFVAVIDRVQMPAEEAAMTELFGSQYDEYAARVSRWFVV